MVSPQFNRSSRYQPSPEPFENPDGPRYIFAQNEKIGSARMEWLRSMRLFVGVVQNGSLSAAGRQHGLSPASVSRHISALEENVGGRLLNRTSRKLTLTEAGEIYFHKVEHILQQINEANESVAQLQAVPRGILRVHSRMLVGHQYIVPALPEFLKQYPDITVDLLLSNHVVDLVEQNIDIDVRIGKLVDSSLLARKLASSERIVCAAPQYLARSTSISAPQDLVAHNCLTYRLNLGRTTWRFKEPDGEVVEVPVTGTFQTDNGQAILAAALAGVGIALMPDWSIRDELATGKLKRLFPKHRVSWEAFENGVYAVYQKSRHQSKKVRAFVEFLGGLFKQKVIS
jgi:DNA-binding transcriptional LysR family regulator